MHFRTCIAFVCLTLLAACETAPLVQQPEPARPPEPERQVFRPMEPIADDADAEPTFPERPAESERPAEQPLAEAASCTPIDTIDKVTFYKTSGGAVSFAADMDVNTDGAITSYSATDPGFYHPVNGLSTRRALNTVCNGLKVVGPDGRTRINYKECPKLLAAFVRFRDAGWPLRDSNGDKIDFFAMEKRPGMGPDKQVPCLLDEEWMVSTTSFPMTGSYAPCDPQRWLDARRVNAIVMPPQVLAAAGATRGGGDLVVVRYRGKAFGAIVGDTNPRKAGEGTLALTAALRALDPQPPRPPSNLGEVYRFPVKRPPVEYFVFPGTKSLAGEIRNDRGAEIAQKALDEARSRGVLATAACGLADASIRGRTLGGAKLITPEEGLNNDRDPSPDGE